MFTIARREANRILTRSNRTRHSGLADAGELQQPEMPDQRGMDDREELETALAGLTTAEREILELHVYGGLTFREMAEVTETPPGNIATRYRSAVAKLRGRLNVASVSASKSVKETKQ